MFSYTIKIERKSNTSSQHTPHDLALKDKKTQKHAWGKGFVAIAGKRRRRLLIFSANAACKPIIFINNLSS
jgi:hypothetical protein